MRIQSTLALAVVASAIAACGGGGGGGATAPLSTAIVPGTTATAAPTSSPVAAATTSSANAAATLTITLAASATSSSTLRRAQNIAPGSQSITLQLIQANGVSVTGTLQTFGITATSPGCSQTAALITCVVSLAAPVGVDVFTAETFSSTTGTGTLLSTGAVRITVAQNTPNAASVSLNGTIASTYLASANGYLGAYSTLPIVASTRLFVIALDNQGNTILNPLTYNTPIALQQTFSGGAADVQLSVQSATTGVTTSTSANYGTVTVTSPSDFIIATILSNITSPASSLTVAAYLTTNGVASPNPVPSGTTTLNLPLYPITPAAPLSVSYNPLNIIGLSPTYDYIYGGTGTKTITGCSGVIGSFQVYGTYFYAYPAAVGSCNATITDAAGATLVLPITVTTTTVSGS